ncbi:DNA-binding response regulator [Nocardioides baekrokdamisoli]|uniref:DNA-binding response regulator n=1 Tax=Nocardioides baekrokdamisoli TaxID=1804624 RepID=A0A3G9IKA7_9ACTN|nr:response regulator transcription factor [Nocardioides baekrokdamisoli]BBH16505.1 DNA-binding response regulator [Nocardioides baekrokdamisoli]
MDPQEVFRRGVRAIVTDDPRFELVGETARESQAASMAGSTAADVVIYDPGTHSARVCAELAALSPTPRMLVLTTKSSQEDLYSMIRSGATGYLLKDCTSADLLGAIALVADGQTIVAPRLAAALVADLNQDTGRQADRSGLTDRELEVLAEVARGLTNRDIARELKVAENTVKNHVRNILDKLGLRSRVEATLYAIKAGLVDPKR